MDTISKARRSWNMAQIRSTNTKPERALGQLLRRIGFRVEQHRRDLPGVPDFALPTRKIAVFLHGCFWHRHPKCKYAYSPKSRRGFWIAKFRANVTRDRIVRSALRQQGWKTIVVWECELPVLGASKDRLRRRLAKTRNSHLGNMSRH